MGLFRRIIAWSKVEVQNSVEEAVLCDHCQAQAGIFNPTAGLNASSVFLEELSTSEHSRRSLPVFVDGPCTVQRSLS